MVVCRLLCPLWTWRLGLPCSLARRAELSLLLQLPWLLWPWRNFAVAAVVTVVPLELLRLPRGDGE